jgi:hypothetical protein
MPRGLPKAVKGALAKSRESALSAVEIYNKPAIKFRTGSYTVLMIIAWTSAFHAYFFRNNIKPYHRRKGARRYEKIDGDYKHWELTECLKHFYKLDTNNPVRKNLEFFVKLRNKIEHRSYDELDQVIFGECQALLLNYNSFVEEHFGKNYSPRESLAFSLQMYADPVGMKAAMDKDKDLKDIVKFVKGFRSSMKPEIYESQSYSFKAFLIQVKNHNTDDVMPIKFINYDSLTTAEQDEIDKIGTVLIKDKIHPVVNAGLKKPSSVVDEVNELLEKEGWEGSEFNMHHHTQLWKSLKVRPEGKSKTPEKTTDKYCKYDEPNRSYLYTSAWVRKCRSEFTKSID